jgi:hypothetical protein
VRRHVRRTQYHGEHKAAPKRPRGPLTLGQSAEPLEPGTQRHGRGQRDHGVTVSNQRDANLKQEEAGLAATARPAARR